jgi:DNA-binding protein YbaB
MKNLQQMQQILRQIQQMQEQFQKQLDELVVEASAGGGW